MAPMSEFGLVELTRQRLRPSLQQATYTPCPVCRGSGYVKSMDSMVGPGWRWIKTKRASG